MADWQPIETANKEERLLLWCPAWDEALACEWFGAWKPEYYEMEWEEEFTHWTSFPEGPK